MWAIEKGMLCETSLCGPFFVSSSSFSDRPHSTSAKKPRLSLPSSIPLSFPAVGCPRQSGEIVSIRPRSLLTSSRQQLFCLLCITGPSSGLSFVFFPSPPLSLSLSLIVSTRFYSLVGHFSNVQSGLLASIANN